MANADVATNGAQVASEPATPSGQAAAKDTVPTIFIGIFGFSIVGSFTATIVFMRSAMALPFIVIFTYMWQCLLQQSVVPTDYPLHLLVGFGLLYLEAAAAIGIVIGAFVGLGAMASWLRGTYKAQERSDGEREATDSKHSLKYRAKSTLKRLPRVVKVVCEALLAILELGLGAVVTRWWDAPVCLIPMVELVLNDPVRCAVSAGVGFAVSNIILVKRLKRAKLEAKSQNGDEVVAEPAEEKKEAAPDTTPVAVDLMV
jgi:hypothetical protein